MFQHLAQPLLPNSSQPRQNRTVSGTLKIQVNQTQMHKQTGHPVQSQQYASSCRRPSTTRPRFRATGRRTCRRRRRRRRRRSRARCPPPSQSGRTLCRGWGRQTSGSIGKRQTSFFYGMTVAYSDSPPTLYVVVHGGAKPEASFVFASDRSLKLCYDRSLANTKLPNLSQPNPGLRGHGTPCTGLDDCLNMLLSCFRKRMSGKRVGLSDFS